MNLFDDLDLVEENGARMDRISYVKEADARIRSALIALESAQPEAEKVADEITQLFISPEDYEGPVTQVTSIIAAALAKAREADAKTIAELGEALSYDFDVLETLLAWIEINSIGYFDIKGAIDKSRAALAKGKE